MTDPDIDDDELKLVPPSQRASVKMGLGARDRRQYRVWLWICDAFGQDSVQQRALRMLEEAIEAYQAACGEREQAHALIDYVFNKPAGTLQQELGGLGVTILGLAETARLSADAAERTEVARVLSLPLEHFRKRNAAKNAAWFKV